MFFSFFGGLGLDELGLVRRMGNINWSILGFRPQKCTQFFSDPDSRISDLISTTMRISRMIPTPYLYPYMGFGIHQPYRIAYGGDCHAFKLMHAMGSRMLQCVHSRHANAAAAAALPIIFSGPHLAP